MTFSGKLLVWTVLFFSSWKVIVGGTSNQNIDAVDNPVSLFEVQGPREVNKFTSGGLYRATIPQNAGTRSFVRSPVKMGLYIRVNSPIVEYVVSGTNPRVHQKSRSCLGTSTFKVEGKLIENFYALKISTRRMLSEESCESYLFTIEARDRFSKRTVDTTKVFIKVQVASNNDAYPRFSNTAVSDTVSLSYPLFQPILRLSTVEKYNAGNVYFLLKQRSKYFGLNPVTGVLFLKRSLPAALTRHDLVAYVRKWDTKFNRKTIKPAIDDTCKITINVRITNEYSPLISVSKITDAVGNRTFIATVTVRDNDGGKNGMIDALIINSGDENGLFALERVTGNTVYRLHTTKPLNSTFSSFRLMFTATDLGNPPKSSSIIYSFKLANLLLPEPRFSEESYSVNVSEIMPIGSVVLQIKALNLKPKSRFSYSIVEGNSSNAFKIEPDTGEIKVAQTLDAETTLFYALKVVIKVSDATVLSTAVNIHIEDFNDHAPAFTGSNHYVEIKENMPLHSTIYSVKATDDDGGENGRLSYWLPYPSPFSVDPNTGVVSVSQVLDRDSGFPEYTYLVVRAGDNGLPMRQETETVVKIRVKPKNDNGPVIKQDVCLIILSADTPVGTKLVQIQATDIDVEENHRPQFLLSSGNAGGYFSINSSSGDVTLAKMLGKAHSPFTLTVTAMDHAGDQISLNFALLTVKTDRKKSGKDVSCGISSAFTRAIILQKERKTIDSVKPVIDENPPQNIWPPQFDKKDLIISVSEDVAVGSLLAIVRASDKDNGYEGFLTYYIVGGNHNQRFGLDMFSGKLKTIAELDREQVSRYELKISVWDSGVARKNAFMKVVVNVEDVNDNPPVFDQEAYNISVPENSGAGMSVLTLSAKDDDAGSNARITYHLVNDYNKLFFIDYNTGEVIANKPLDFEQEQLYRLDVLALDGQLTNRHVSRTAIIVSVMDKNDNVPLVIPGTQNVFVMKDLPAQSPVTQVTAYDPDSGLGGTLDFSLAKSFGSGLFFIDRVTGLLSLKESLSASTTSDYNLTIIVSDQGQPSFTTTAHVNIHIIQRASYENLQMVSNYGGIIKYSVPENVPAGYQVAQVAKGSDLLERQSSFLFSIIDGTDVTMFSLTDTSAVLTTTKSFDREQVPYYWLTVQVVGHGSKQFHSNMQLLIKVTDENDNNPIFHPPVYQSKIPENTEADEVVVKVSAYDKDSGSNGKLTYSIVDGNAEAHFKIHKSSGLITTTNIRLDYEKKTVYKLVVSVTDHGSVPRTNQALVTILVQDENDNSPKFEDNLSIEILLSEGSTIPKNTFLGQALATDNDSGRNGNLEFRIRSGNEDNKLRIDPKSGQFFSNVILHFFDAFQLSLEVKDGGQPSLSVTSVFDVFVTQRSILHKSRSPLVFPQNQVNTSISEDSPVGHKISISLATNKNGDILQSVAYSIKSGNEDQKFRLYPSEQCIKLIAQLDPTVVYRVVISATDGFYLCDYTLVVEVSDVNDHYPVPDMIEKIVTVSENVVPGRRILSVTASDLDTGVNGRITYSLKSAANPRSLELFDINRSSGEITVKGLLDHEDMRSHVLRVAMKDSGKESKESNMYVVVNVADVNEWRPVFLKPSYHVTIPESLPRGSDVVKVIAKDKDLGLDAMLKYSIISGNVGYAFSIKPQSGVIQTNKVLNASRVSQYVLTVEARDDGSYGLSSTTNITLKLLGNGQRRGFAKDVFTVSVFEAQPLNTFVESVRFDGLMIYYAIVEETGCMDSFQINPYTGTITTKKVLDAEEISSCQLRVRAEDSDGYSQESTVDVQIIDVNDNRPIIQKNVFFGYVHENAGENTPVLNADGDPLAINATDKDRDRQNSELKYELIRLNGKDRYFKVDETTGVLLTSKLSLDYEKAKSHDLVVRVSDRGTPTLSRTATIVVHVKNANDIAPEFSKSVFDALIFLPTQKNVVVTSITARDRDNLGNLTYSISQQDTPSLLAIDTSRGLVSIADPSKTTEGWYNGVVKASDGKHWASTRLRIVFKPFPVSSLQFQKSSFTAHVVENTSLVQTVFTPFVQGYKIGDKIRHMLGNLQDMFTINEDTGVVKTKPGIVFDREETSSYRLVVMAQDDRTPPRRARCLVDVIVDDVNDCRPTFPSPPIFFVVPKSSKIGSTVAIIAASDCDSGKNGQVRYEIKGDRSGIFGIDPSTGGLKVLGQLVGLPTPTEFSLVIEARDLGETPFISKAEVSVRIEAGDACIFEKPFYTVELAEDAAVGYVLKQLHARCPAGRPVFNIISGDKRGQFYCDLNTGELSLTSGLDFETTTHYTLSVRAKDSNTGTSSQATVNIVVKDVNDNPPLFKASPYFARVREDSPVGTVILRIVTTDLDWGINQKRSYEVVRQTAVSPDAVSINRTSGVLRLQKELDHETQQRFEVTVRVTDHGHPSLSSETVVMMFVEDVNDNAPVFQLSHYSATVRENAGPKHFVTQVLAMDADETDFLNLRYGIVSGDGKKYFKVNATSGEVSLSKVPGLPLGKVNTLNLSVSDGNFTAYATLDVVVGQSNNHAPRFRSELYHAQVTENYPADTYVAMVTATDEDLGTFGEVVYAINSQKVANNFKVDERSGMITTRRPLDRELISSVTIPLRAMDKGGKSAFCDVQVSVLDENDNQPQFLMSSYTAVVPAARASVGESVIRVTAVDLDDGPNSALTYSLIGQTSPFVFGINSTSGEIKFLRKPRETVYKFYVRVNDNGFLKLTSYARVQVSIVTVLFHFKNKEYFVSLSETRRGSVSKKFDLVDSNGALVTSNASYSVETGTSRRTNKLGTFTMSSAGVLQISKSLDYETVSSYDLTIRANRSSFFVYATVHIDVLDKNDNKPEFESNPYDVSVPEDARKGTRIVQVRAHDKDSKENGVVTYEMSSESKQYSDVFAIDEKSGWVTTKSTLDREIVPYYVLKINAKDHGRDNSLVGTTRVNVKLDDVNDSPPVFSRKIYKISVREDSPVGSEVLTLNTTDKDTNSRVIYYIVAGDINDRFDIDQTSGKIFVRAKIDREMLPRYQLNIVAFDGVYTASAFVEIEVMDVNDNAPICHQSYVRVHVYENMTIGTSIAVVNATDRDEDVSSPITFAIFNHQEKFSIDDRTGVIVLERSLDRETKASYSFLVSASDGNAVCYTNVTIDLLDVNDSPPQFTRTRYIKIVAMNSEKRAVLLKVEASDNDLGMNRKLSYSFANASTAQIFSIEKDTGVVSLNSRLLWRDEEKFVFGVVATDGGVPSLSSEATVEVIVSTTVNCSFAKNEFKKEIREDTRPAYQIENMSVTCRDEKIVVVYKIAGDDMDTHRLFAISKKTGKLTLKSSLDYEIAHLHIFTVEAFMKKPSGKMVLISSASVRIKVLDCNDNKPVFDRPFYEATVNEGSAVKTLVIDLSAHDNDTTSKVRYAIVTSSSDVAKFAINPVSGTLTVHGSLDREETEKYELTIRAQDDGKPPLFSDVPLRIKIKDVNDNPPVVDKVIKRLVRTDTPLGTTVLQLRPTDADGPSNSQPFKFTVLQGANSWFVLNSSTGALLTNRQLSHHNTTFSMVLRTTDSGSPAMFAETDVILTVVKESLNPPKVRPVTVYVNMYANKFNGGIIGKVVAQDSDKDSILRYSLVKDTGQFSIGYTDGAIKMTSVLPPRVYSLQVRVTDGSHEATTRVSVRVSEITTDVVKNSVTIRITGKTLSSFVSSSLSSTIDALADMKSCNVKDVYLWSIQTAPNNMLDVVFAVQKPTEKGFFDPADLRETLEGQLKKFQKLCGVVVFFVGIFPCDERRCSTGMECRDKINMLNQWSILASDSTTFLSYKNKQGSECVCPEGVSDLDCLPSPSSECLRNPCRSGLTCVDRPSGYECVCPSDKNCHPECPGDKCHTDSITFGGDSYIRYSLIDPRAKMTSFSVSLRTTKLSGTVFSAKGEYDYFIAEIVDGRIRVRFNYGSGEGIGRIDQVKVNDGKWHDVKVTRKERNVRLSLDAGQYLADAVSPGYMRFLNVDMSDVIVGGELPRRSIRSTNTDAVANGYFGCMESPRLNDKDLPLSGRNALATAETHGVSRNCSIDVCHLFFCRNGGQCTIVEQNGYKVPSCVCKTGFTGYDCSKDVDECASLPCKNSGICINTIGSFSCDCVDRNFMGKVCETQVSVAAVSRTEPLGTREFIYIGSTVFVLIILSIIIVLVCRFCNKRTRKTRAREKHIEMKMKVTDDGMSLHPPPPPPPRRGDVEDSPTQLSSRAPSWDYADLPEMVPDRRKLTRTDGIPKVPKRPRHISETQSIPDVPEKPTQYRSSRASSQSSIRVQSFPDVSEIGVEGLEMIRRGTKDMEKLFSTAADVVDDLLGTQCARAPSECDSRSHCSQEDEDVEDEPENEPFSAGHLETYDDNEVAYFIPENDRETTSGNESEDETSMMLEKLPDVRHSRGEVLQKESQL